LTNLRQQSTWGELSHVNFCGRPIFSFKVIYFLELKDSHILITRPEPRNHPNTARWGEGGAKKN